MARTKAGTLTLTLALTLAVAVAVALALALTLTRHAPRLVRVHEARRLVQLGRHGCLVRARVRARVRVRVRVRVRLRLRANLREDGLARRALESHLHLERARVLAVDPAQVAVAGRLAWGGR